jgi:predicted MPP superfamily phosphohydrolase
MPLRFLIFFSIISLITALSHWYVGGRIIHLMQLQGGSRWFAWALVALLAILMFAGPSLQRAPHNIFVDVILWSGFLWMGFFWLLFCGIVVSDLLGLVFQGLHKIPGLSGVPVLGEINRSRILSFLLPILGITGVWSVYQALSAPKIHEVTVAIPDLPQEFEGYRIAHITDTHLGPLLRRSWTQSLVQRVDSAQADLVVHTGDLVDGSVQALRPYAEPLMPLRGKDGAIFVTGNHESYSGPKDWSTEVSRWGWTVLLNQSHVIQRGQARLVIGGVTDEKEGQFLPERECDPPKAFANTPNDENSVRILLAHQPKSALRAQGLNIDLQLSGHTHGGQIWPFNYLVLLQQPMVSGLAKVGDIQVFTSNGTGFWGPPLRLGASPEVPILVLKRQ